MASFQAKIGWKRMRKRENKNTITFRSYPKRNVKFQEKSKKIQKKSKYTIMPLLQEKQVGKCGERENIKIISPFRSYMTSNRKFQKNRKNIPKIKKYLYGFLSSQNRFKKAEKERK